jgi:hypothetical protein
MQALKPPASDPASRPPTSGLPLPVKLFHRKPSTIFDGDEYLRRVTLILTNLAHILGKVVVAARAKRPFRPPPTGRSDGHTKE